jgi:hypothetical protein
MTESVYIGAGVAIAVLAVIVVMATCVIIKKRSNNAHLRNTTHPPASLNPAFRIVGETPSARTQAAAKVKSRDEATYNSIDFMPTTNGVNPKSKDEARYNSIGFMQTANGVDQPHELYEAIADDNDDDHNDGTYEVVFDDVDRTYDTATPEQPTYAMAQPTQQPIYEFATTEDETDWDL